MIKNVVADLGFGDNKVLSTDCLEGLKFDSTFEKRDKITGEGDDVFEITYKGETYVVGAGRESITETKEKIVHVSTKLFVLASIVKSIRCSAGQKNSINVNLVLGLPAKYHSKFANKLKEEILNMGTTTVIVDGIEAEITFNRVAVAMQGAIVSLFFDERMGNYEMFNKLFKNRTVLLCDIGNGTIDTMLIKNGQLDVRDISKLQTYPVGMKQFYRLLVDNINYDDAEGENNIDSFYTKKEEVEDRILLGHFHENDVDYPILGDNKYGRIVKRTIHEYLNDTIGEMDDNYGLSKINGIILIGGGAELLKEYFEMRIQRKVYLVKESDICMKSQLKEGYNLHQFLNALNYYKLAIENFGTEM